MSVACRSFATSRGSVRTLIETRVVCACFEDALCGLFKKALRRARSSRASHTRAHNGTFL